jgi:hypothetical protein
MMYAGRGWPALMDLETAGDYLGLATGSLISLLRRENVSPVDVGGRSRRWRRQDLDALVERLPACWPREMEEGGGKADQLDSALAAVERRALGRRAPARGRIAHEVPQSHSAA